MGKWALTTYRGVDYGRGLTNVGEAARYGVIPCNALGEAWHSEADPIYPEPHCGECGNEASETDDGHRCTYCDRDLDDRDFEEVEPIGWVVDDGAVRIESSDGIDAFVTKSPFVTFAQFCSPCAPGACYLLSPTPVDGPGDSNRCYCLGPNWFDEDPPYPIWCASTGKAIKP